MKSNLVIAVLLGSISLSEAVSLDKNRHRYYSWDPHEDTIEHHLSRYSDARRGILKTEEEYAKDAAKLDPNTIYKHIDHRRFDHDDTGTKYATSHRCFGSPCVEPKSDKYAMRPKYNLAENLLDADEDMHSNHRFVTTHQCYGAPCEGDR